MFDTLSLQLTGTQALLVNSPETINPFSPISREIKAITDIATKNRTEKENERLHFLKWNAGLYFDPEKGPCIPAGNILRSIQAAAALSRKGKGIERGVTVRGGLVALEYDGPRTPKEMWDDEAKRFTDVRSGKVASGARIPVIRPIFAAGWKCTVTFDIAPDIISVSDFLQYAYSAGRLIGTGTYRSKFGRFSLTLLDTTGDEAKVRAACKKFGIKVHGVRETEEA